MRGLLIESWPCILRVSDSKLRAERSQWRGRQFSVHASARPILAWANGEPLYTLSITPRVTRSLRFHSLLITRGIGILKALSESGTLLERGETLPLRGTTPGQRARSPSGHARMGRDDRMRGWARDTARPRPRVGAGGSVIRRAALSLAATDRTQIQEWVPDRRGRTHRSDRTRRCPGAAPEPETVEEVGWGDRDRRGWRVRERDL